MFCSNVTIPRSCTRFYFCCTSAVRTRHLKSEPLKGPGLRDIDHLLQLFVCFQFPLQSAGDEALSTLQDQAHRGCFWGRLSADVFSWLDDLSSDGSVCYCTSRYFYCQLKLKQGLHCLALSWEVTKWKQAGVMDFSFFLILDLRGFLKYILQMELHFRIFPIFRRGIFSKNFCFLIIFLFNYESSLRITERWDWVPDRVYFQFRVTVR